MSKFTFLLIMLGLSAIGIVTALYGVMLARRTMRLGRESLSWPEVAGRIDAADIHHRRQFNSDGPDTDFYQPRVAYSYAVADVTHTGSRIAFRDLESASPKDAQNILGTYPVGTQVRVRHDPNDPANSVLEPGAPGVGSYWWIGAILFVTLICVGMGLWALLFR